MPTVGALVEEVRALLGVPADDEFYENADIIDWLHEGALELFPWLPEESLTATHLKSYTYPVYAPLTGNRWYGTVPSSFMKVKNIEIEKTQNSENWYLTEFVDYTTFSASISKLNVLNLTNPSDYRSAKWGSKIFVFPIPLGRTKLNYFAFPTKNTNQLVTADYPDIILSAIKDFAVSRGKAKEPNAKDEVVSYYNRFNAVLQKFMGLQQKEAIER